MARAHRARTDVQGAVRTGRFSAPLNATERYLDRERLRGWDPYDALCSPVFALPVLRSNRLIRFGSQQVVKRLPFNVRPLLRIPKRINPVSVGLYLQGQADRARADAGSFQVRQARAEASVALLASLVSPGWSGACWGYPFDWEARHASIPEGTPTIVATGMVTNALVHAGRVFDLPAARELVLSSTAFVINDLSRTAGPDDSFCWSYSPFDRQVVLNATLKGSRLLAQAHQLGAPADVLEPARASAAFVAAHQRDSGAWPYAIGDERGWADNFHTGYVLECFAEYRRGSGDDGVAAVMERGWRYYRERFFTPDGTPKYYDDDLGPIDATACAQAIITLCEYGDPGLAARAADRALRLLGRPDGSFAYQRRRGRLVKIPFLRWSTAWMYAALSRLEATAP